VAAGGGSDSRMDESVGGMRRRTIHPDGTVTPLTGKPLDKRLVKEKGIHYPHQSFYSA